MFDEDNTTIQCPLSMGEFSKLNDGAIRTVKNRTCMANIQDTVKIRSYKNNRPFQS